MGLIYKITNDIINQVYIGLTTRTIEIRWAEHKRYAGQNNSAIDNAIYELGISHFKCELIQDNIPNDELHQAERDWITYYNSYKEGYNLTPGGNGRSLTDEQIQQIHKMYFNDQKSIREICAQLDLPHSTVYHRVASDKQYSLEENRKRSKRDQYKAIDIYTAEGEYLDTCYSITQAEKLYNINSKGAHESIIKGYLNKGYRLAYANQPLVIANNKRSVLQFSPDGDFIAQYNGMREAGRQTGIDYTGIVKVCKRTQLSAGGYFWYKETNFDQSFVEQDKKQYEETMRYRKNERANKKIK